MHNAVASLAKAVQCAKSYDVTCTGALGSVGIASEATISSASTTLGAAGRAEPGPAGKGTMCTAPPASQTRLRAVSGLSHLGSA
jgi:hypothetical protein